MSNRKIWTSDNKLNLAESLEGLKAENLELRALLYEMDLRLKKLEAQEPTQLMQLRKRTNEAKQ